MVILSSTRKIKMLMKMQDFVHINTLEYIYHKPNFDALCGTNNYLTVMTFKYNLSYAHNICLR